MSPGCVARPIVTVASDDVAARYVASAALVAVTLHVPALVVDNALPEIEHPSAVPDPDTVHETAPEPFPPLTVSVNGDPNVPEVEVTVRADCDAFEIVKTTSSKLAATFAVAAPVARTVQVPAPVYVSSPVDTFTVHVVVV